MPDRKKHLKSTKNKVHPLICTKSYNPSLITNPLKLGSLVVPLNFDMHAQISHENKLPMGVVNGRDFEFTRDLWIRILKSWNVLWARFSLIILNLMVKLNESIKLLGICFKQWEQYLPFLGFVTTNSKHTSIWYSPIMFMHGFLINQNIVHINDHVWRNNERGGHERKEKLCFSFFHLCEG